MRHRVHRAIGLAAFALLAISAVSGTAANSNVGTSRAGLSTFPVTPNDLKPPECAGIFVDSLVVGSGTVVGTGTANLILGGPGNDTLRGLGGPDCIVGGGGNDILLGQGGSDVLIGGPGNDTLTGGGGYDVCYGGPGFDLVDCESWPDWGLF